MRSFSMLVFVLAIAVAAGQAQAAKRRAGGHRVGPQEDLPGSAKSVQSFAGIAARPDPEPATGVPSVGLVGGGANAYGANRAVNPRLGRFLFEDDDWCWTGPRIHRRPPPPPPQRFGDGLFQRNR